MDSGGRDRVTVIMGIGHDIKKVRWNCRLYLVQY